MDYIVYGICIILMNTSTEKEAREVLTEVESSKANKDIIKPIKR